MAVAATVTIPPLTYAPLTGAVIVTTGGVPLGWQACSPACNGTPLPGKNRPALPADYSAFLNTTGLNGARLGLTRSGIQSAPPQVVAAFDAAVQAIAQSPLPDMMLIGRLKRKKLALKDEISRIEAQLTPDIIA